MRRLALSAGLVVSLFAQGQSVPSQPAAARNKPLAAKQADHPRSGAPWTSSYIDPVCPVNWHNGIYPHTEELTILYYPFAHRATIQEPQSLVVHVVFDALEGPLSREDRQLTHREDGVWQAKIDMRDRMTRYAAYWFEDPGRRAVDNNQGDYFDVLFCDFDGRRSSASVAAMARSYTGSMRTQGIGRPIDYAKAEQVLEAAIAPDRTHITSWATFGATSYIFTATQRMVIRSW